MVNTLVRRAFRATRPPLFRNLTISTWRRAASYFNNDGACEIRLAMMGHLFVPVVTRDAEVVTVETASGTCSTGLLMDTVRHTLRRVAFYASYMLTLRGHFDFVKFSNSYQSCAADRVMAAAPVFSNLTFGGCS